MNGAANTLIHAAAAQIAYHRFIDLIVGGMRRFCEQPRSLHDLARLTVSALWHLLGDPSQLQRMGMVS